MEEDRSKWGEHRAELAVSLWEELGDILEMKAVHEEALHAYQAALGQVPQGNPISQARLHRKVGAVRREQRFYNQELEACQQAEIALGKQPGLNENNWWDEWLEVQVERTWAHYWLAQWADMERLVNQLQPVLQERGSGVSRMRFLMASCLLQLRKHRYVVSDEMLANSHEALAASQRWGTLKIRMDCQFELGFLHLWRGELDDAEEHLQASLELAENSGVFPVRTLCLTYLTILHRFWKQVEKVSAYAVRALKAAEAAHMPDYIAAAKGNQAWLSWHKGDLSATQQLGQQALDLWKQTPLVYPFQWQALWPLIGAALGQGQEADAWTHIHALLEPTQQLLPDALNTTLEVAIQAQDKGQPEAARIHLYKALSYAGEMGYL